MEEEAEQVQMKLRDTTPAGGVITAARETDLFGKCAVRLNAWWRCRERVAPSRYYAGPALFRQALVRPLDQQVGRVSSPMPER
jgi:hypothetical protein